MESESKVRVIVPWVLCALLSLAFVGAGSQKLLGELATEASAHFGYSVGFMQFIGVCEVAAAIGLLIPQLSSWSAAGMIPIMIGAVFSHLTHDPVSQAVPAAVLLVLVVIVGWWRRDRALFLAPASERAAVL